MNGQVKSREQVSAVWIRGASQAIVFGFVVGALTLSGAVGTNIVVSETETIVPEADEMQVDVQPQAKATLCPSKHVVTVRAQANAQVELRGAAVPSEKVGLWLDASNLSSFTYANSTLYDPTGAYEKELGGKYRHIERWSDTRETATEKREWSALSDWAKTQTYTTPFAITNAGPNGFCYVSFGADKGSVRLPFIKRDADGNDLVPATQGSEPPNAFPLKYVIMVFGSQNGGGLAIMGGLILKRYGVDYWSDAGKTVTASTPAFEYDRDFRIDGVSVPAQTTGLNGGWQILSFAADDATDCKGLGMWVYKQGCYGGQNYAEIIAFTNAPSTQEIFETEQYLARKWGVASRDIGEYRLYGSGAVTAAGDEVKVGGEFKGILQIPAGTTVRIADAALPPSAPTAGAVGWYDPDRVDMTTFQSGTEQVVGQLNNLGSGADGQRFDLFAGNFKTWVELETRGWGEAHRWYDYRGTKTGGVGLMRFNDGSSWSGNTLSIRTGFMVLDTTYGAGTPFLDTSLGGSIFANRTSATATLFRLGSAPGESLYTADPAYLNGFSVKGNERAYNKRPEVLSFVFHDTFPLKCLGFYNASKSDDFGLVHGETIFYSEALSDDDRRSSEAYLMHKWLGLSPTGYGDARGMSVSGSGKIVTLSGANRPQVDSSFAGELTIPYGPIRFRFDGNVLTDAIVAPDATVSLPETLIVDVVAARRLPAGNHMLVSVGKLNGVESLRLGELDGVPEHFRKRIRLQKADNSIVLTVEQQGLVVVVQ